MKLSYKSCYRELFRKSFNPSHPTLTFESGQALRLGGYAPSLEA